ncbi:hypothetical protein [Arthrobacter koreensis]|uniref:hypothetical protein n=1 Tax=Arthrobacter koreensis TaxID=199136 RepID=UPI002DC0332E|nr:hypothetical protein [Arthrobacter koreensis]MEB7503828.1 hypothetical protein [Arthrobacter koreensis]
MEHQGPAPADKTHGSTGAVPRQGTDFSGSAAQLPVQRKRSPLRLAATALAAVLAVAGVASLAALLLEALRGEVIWPGFAAGAFYALPLAFLIMAGLVIDSIVRRRRG